jgi:hypothetical protein
MMRSALVFAFAVLLVSLTAVRAEALSVRDVIELTKAGLSEPVLLALIDVDRSVFSIDTATLKQLKSEGVSDTVIVAMIRSGRAPNADVPPPMAQEPAPMPEPVAQDASEPVEMDAPPPQAPAVPQFVPYLVPVPFYIAVPVTASSGKNHHESAQRPRTAAPAPCFVSKIPEWGFGGKVGPQPAAACQ